VPLVRGVGVHVVPVFPEPAEESVVGRGVVGRVREREPEDDGQGARVVPVAARVPEQRFLVEPCNKKYERRVKSEIIFFTLRFITDEDANIRRIF
jgi:hypothetical protein